jgi:hypothetical protein
MLFKNFRKEAEKMTEWEYKVLIVEVKEEPEKELNKLGKEGWELVSISVEDRIIFSVLKRKKVETG